MKYKTEVFKFKDLRTIIKKPDYQRNFIWKDKKKEGLIETVKKGLPIGSILLSEKIDGYYLLIDGLQRISTLNEIKSNPFKYISEKEISQELIKENLINNIDDAKNIFYEYRDAAKIENLKNIKNIIIEIIKRESMNDTSIPIMSKMITQYLIKDIAFFYEHNTADLMIGVDIIIKHLLNIVNVDEITIPSIIFSGTDEELSYIFEKLNSGGVKLSKYDIFAAQWRNLAINVKNDNELIETIIEKYTESSNIEGIEIDGFDEEDLKEIGELSLFEYSFALAKVISNHSDFLFNSKEISQVDSFGFNLLAAIFGIKNQDMHKLKDKIEQNRIDFIDLKTKILICIRDLEKVLERWLRSLDNKKVLFEFKEFQVVSFIATLFKLNFKIENNQILSIKKENSRIIQSFLNNIHLHYLLDNVKNEWGNAGDTKLNELVLGDVSNNRYNSKPDHDLFKTAFDNWLNENNSYQIKPVKTLTKIFLNYLVKSKVNLTSIKPNTKFNYDHIITQKKLSKFTSINSNYPLSTPCNLVIIPEYDNKSKRELSYYEWEDQHSRATKLDYQLLKDYMYPDRDEIRFSETNETLTFENYSHFLKNRKNYLLLELEKLYSK